MVLLARNEVDFVIVGGVAATLQGSVLQTFDLDICYSRDPKNLDRLAMALRGAPPGTPFVWDSKTLGHIAGISAYPEVRAKSQTVTMYGLAFFILFFGRIDRGQARGWPGEGLAGAAGARSLAGSRGGRGRTRVVRTGSSPGCPRQSDAPHLPE
jgi:hypothetical protein